MGIGSGENGEITFLDTISIISFCIGILNYEENLTQSDKQDLEDRLNAKMDAVLNDIHSHLQSQDKLLQNILKQMEEM